MDNCSFRHSKSILPSTLSWGKKNATLDMQVPTYSLWHSYNAQALDSLYNNMIKMALSTTKGVSGISVSSEEGIVANRALERLVLGRISPLVQRQFSPSTYQLHVNPASLSNRWELALCIILALKFSLTCKSRLSRAPLSERGAAQSRLICRRVQLILWLSLVMVLRKLSRLEIRKLLRHTIHSTTATFSVSYPLDHPLEQHSEFHICGQDIILGTIFGLIGDLNSAELHLHKSFLAGFWDIISRKLDVPGVESFINPYLKVLARMRYSQTRSINTDDALTFSYAIMVSSLSIIQESPTPASGILSDLSLFYNRVVFNIWFLRFPSLVDGVPCEDWVSSNAVALDAFKWIRRRIRRHLRQPLPVSITGPSRCLLEFVDLLMMVLTLSTGTEYPVIDAETTKRLVESFQPSFELLGLIPSDQTPFYHFYLPFIQSLSTHSGNWSFLLDGLKCICTNDTSCTASEYFKASVGSRFQTESFQSPSSLLLRWLIFTARGQVREFSHLTSLSAHHALQSRLFCIQSLYLFGINSQISIISSLFGDEGIEIRLLASEIMCHLSFNCVSPDHPIAFPHHNELAQSVFITKTSLKETFSMLLKTAVSLCGKGERDQHVMESFGFWAFHLTHFVLLKSHQAANSEQGVLEQLLAREIVGFVGAAMAYLGQSSDEHPPSEYIRHTLAYILSGLLEGPVLLAQTLPPFCSIVLLRAVLPLLRKLRQDVDPGVRYTVLETCGRILGFQKPRTAIVLAEHLEPEDEDIINHVTILLSVGGSQEDEGDETVRNLLNSLIRFAFDTYPYLLKSSDEFLSPDLLECMSYGGRNEVWDRSMAKSLDLPDISRIFPSPLPELSFSDAAGKEKIEGSYMLIQQPGNPWMSQALDHLELPEVQRAESAVYPLEFGQDMLAVSSSVNLEFNQPHQSEPEEAIITGMEDDIFPAITERVNSMDAQPMLLNELDVAEHGDSMDLEVFFRTHRAPFISRTNQKSDSLKRGEGETASELQADINGTADSFNLPHASTESWIFGDRYLPSKRHEKGTQSLNFGSLRIQNNDRNTRVYSTSSYGMDSKAVHFHPPLSPRLRETINMVLRHLHFSLDPLDSFDYWEEYSNGLRVGNLFSIKLLSLQYLAEHDTCSLNVMEPLHAMLEQAFRAEPDLFLAMLGSRSSDVRGCFDLLSPKTSAQFTSVSDQLVTWIRGLHLIHGHLLPASRMIRGVEVKLRRPLSLVQTMVLLQDRVTLQCLMTGVASSGVRVRRDEASHFLAPQ